MFMEDYNDFIVNFYSLGFVRSRANVCGRGALRCLVCSLYSINPRVVLVGVNHIILYVITARMRHVWKRDNTTEQKLNCYCLLLY